jgi:membrane protease YdiL (CAAX protease family)
MSESPPPEIEPSRFVRFGVWFYGAMALVAVLWRVGLYDEPIWWREEPPGNLAWPVELALGLGVAAVVVVLSYVLTEATAWGGRMARAMAEPLRGLGVPDALLLASASGLAEELFFRGALQPRVGLVVASVLFGALHFAPRRELLPWTGFAVLMGFAFGAMFEWTGSLLAPVVAHTAINGVNLPLLVRRYGTP